MDEVWQRHKAFILQCIIGGIVLLIALGVKSSMYDEIENTQGANERRLKELKSKLDGGEAPSPASIRNQEATAAAGDKANRALAEEVASVASPRGDQTDYVRENVGWVLSNIGKENEEDNFVSLYSQLRQSALFQLREEARNELVSRAATMGKTIDETLGVGAGIQDEDVPIAIHGLAMAVEVISRALAIEVLDPQGTDAKVEGIDSVDRVRISVRGRRGRAEDTDPDGVRLFTVSMTVRGGPDAVMELIRSFNNRENHVGRRMVLDSYDGFERERADQDRVQVSISLIGLHHVAVATQIAGESGEQ